MQDCVQALVSQVPHKVLGCHLSNDTFNLDVREPTRFPCGVHSPCDPANVASAPERPDGLTAGTSLSPPSFQVS